MRLRDLAVAAIGDEHSRQNLVSELQSQLEERAKKLFEEKNVSLITTKSMASIAESICDIDLFDYESDEEDLRKTVLLSAKGVSRELRRKNFLLGDMKSVAEKSVLARDDIEFADLGMPVIFTSPYGYYLCFKEYGDGGCSVVVGKTIGRLSVKDVKFYKSLDRLCDYLIEAGYSNIEIKRGPYA